MSLAEGILIVMLFARPPDAECSFAAAAAKVARRQALPDPLMLIFLDI
jgi:hypothetical protein